MAPREPSGGRHVLFEHFWVEMGDQEVPEDSLSADASGQQFVLTPSVRKNLQNLARAVVLRCVPIGFIAEYHAATAIRSQSSNCPWSIDHQPSTTNWFSVCTHWIISLLQMDSI